MLLWHKQFRSIAFFQINFLLFTKKIKLYTKGRLNQQKVVIIFHVLNCNNLKLRRRQNNNGKMQLNEENFFPVMNFAALKSTLRLKENGKSPHYGTQQFINQFHGFQLAFCTCWSDLFAIANESFGVSVGKWMGFWLAFVLPNVKSGSKQFHVLRLLLLGIFNICGLAVLLTFKCLL